MHAAEIVGRYVIDKAFSYYITIWDCFTWKPNDRSCNLKESTLEYTFKTNTFKDCIQKQRDINQLFFPVN